jgi:hypothetical protein
MGSLLDDPILVVFVGYFLVAIALPLTLARIVAGSKDRELRQLIDKSSASRMSEWAPSRGEYF